MHDRLVHREPVRVRLLAGDDHVDVLARTQAVIVGRQQRVGVRRKVYAHNFALLVHHVIDEARILVAEAVVVLAPHVRAQEVVERGDGAAPLDLIRDLEPLGVLVHHRIDDVNKRLVTREKAVAASQQVALEPALHLVLGEHLHDAALLREILGGVVVFELAIPLLARDFIDRLETVRGGFIGAEHAEVMHVVLDDVAQPHAKNASGLGIRSTVMRHVDAVLAKVGEHEVVEDFAAVRDGVCTHALESRRRSFDDLVDERAVLVDELLDLVGLEPFAQVVQVLIGVACARERHLVAAPRALGFLPVDLLRAGPALRRAEHDHRPHRALDVAFGGTLFNVGDHVERLVEHRRETLVRLFDRLVVEATFEEQRCVPIADHERAKLILADARKNGGVRDLVPVEVENRQHNAVVLRVDEFVRVPARRERASLGFAVAHDRKGDLIGIVEHRTVRVRERVAELTALVDGARSFGGDVRGDAAGERELREQLREAALVLRDRGVGLGVGAFEVARGNEARAAVAWARHVKRVEAALFNRAVRVRVQEREPGGSAPVAKQTRLHVIARKWLPQKRVVHEVDLAHRKVIRGAPPRIELMGFFGGEWMGWLVRPFVCGAHVSPCP